MEYSVTPCGACRQVLQEFNVKYCILLTVNNKMTVCTLNQLLPTPCQIKHLGK